MSGNKTLYTTAKCRSMTTKSEFVDMWDNSKKEYKTVMLKNRTGWVESNHYIFFSSEDGQIFIELLIGGINCRGSSSMINIDMIEEVI